MAEATGRVRWGSNNIYCVEDLARNGHFSECRIKGKHLLVSGEYNVLVPGDLVRYDQLPTGSQVIDRLPRKNALSRWNKKDACPQAFAANLDAAFCVCSPDSPPF